MSKTYTPAQKKAFAVKMAKARAAPKRRKSTAAPHFRVVRGRGGYAEDWANTGREWGGKFGGLAGGVADLATSIADKVGPAVEGLGAYKVKYNTLYKLGEGNSPPIVRNAKDGRFIIRHREYLRDVIVPANNNGAFAVTAFKINPGLQSTFPWLSSVAQSFQQYKLRGMIFNFKSNYSEYNNAQAGMGTVILGTEYDATLPNFVSKIQMENHQYAMSAKPSESQLHPIECARDTAVLQELFIRQTVPDDNNDLRFSDYGTFQLAYAGIPNSATDINLGELWVTYEIELLKPQIGSPGALVLSSYYFNNAGFGTTALCGTLTTMKSDSQNEISANFDYSLAANQVRITLADNIGQCRVLFTFGYVYGAAVARTSPAVAAVSNCTIPTPVWGLNNMQAPGNAESSTRQVFQFYVDCSGSGPAVFDFSVVFGNTPNTLYLVLTTMDTGIGSSALVPYVPFLAVASSVSSDVGKLLGPGDYGYGLSDENSEVSDEKSDEKLISIPPAFSGMSESTRARVIAALSKAPIR